MLLITHGWKTIFQDNEHYQELKKRASLAGDVHLPPLAGENPSRLDKINEENNIPPSETARFDFEWIIISKSKFF